jgi:hypothetical protein
MLSTQARVTDNGGNMQRLLICFVIGLGLLVGAFAPTSASAYYYHRYHRYHHHYYHHHRYHHHCWWRYGHRHCR